jgi:WD repeat-containing protein 19
LFFLKDGAEWSRRLDVEPTFLGIGPGHYAAGMNNRVWFYALGPPDGHGAQQPGPKRFVKDKEYSANVQSVRLNELYAAVLHDGKVLLHLVSWRLVHLMCCFLFD